MNRRVSDWWMAAAMLFVIAVAAAWAYAPSLDGPFVYDDHFFVARNDAIKDPRRAGEWLVSPGTASEGRRWGTIFRPVRTVSYALDYGGWRENPFGYHLTSILLHLAAIAGVFALTWRWTASLGGALLGTAVFALHPVPAEAAFFIGARSDVLAAIPVLALAVWALAPGPRTWGRRAGELGLILLAVACKEPAAAAVPAVALALWLRDREPGAFGRAFRWSLPGGAVVIGYGVLRTLAIGLTSQYDFLAGGDPALTWGSALRARVFELGQVIRPGWLSPSHLGVPVMASWADAAFWLSLLAVAGCGWMAWRCRRVAPAVTAGIGWWVLFLLPASQLLPINMLMANRWLYLPFAGLACIVASGVAAAGTQWGPHGRRALLAIGVLWVAGCGLQTRARAHAWTDPVRLWREAVDAWPEDSGAHTALVASHCARASRLQARDPAGAERERAAAVDAALQSGDWVTGVDPAAMMAANLMQHDRAAVARRLLERAGGGDPSLEAELRLAEIDWRAGAHAQAAQRFDRLTAPDFPSSSAVDRVRLGEVFYTVLEPTEVDGRRTRALVWLQRARLAYGDGRLDEADRSARQALAEWPESQMAVWARATLLRLARRPDLAAKAIEQVWPQAAVQPLYQLRAELAELNGRPDIALQSRVRAVRRWPFAPELWGELGDQYQRVGEFGAARACIAREQDLAK